uniref:mitogen-activated protein kinase kinase n=1 Tax=Eptatretus burgeri TaxID=7764 RepID=A0A8C4WWP2_EPTBU
MKVVLVACLQVILLDITQEVQKQIMSELEILYKCSSPYIIAFYGVFFVENRVSICTEFMDGGSLDIYGVIPEPVLGRIVVAVRLLLAQTHLFHLNVKPSNILVNTTGQVKLCDFGVSTQLVNSIAKTYVGTSVYMAPERISGEQYGIHSDVWSLGITFMEPLQLLQFILDEVSLIHPFIHQYNDENTEVLSMWLCRTLEERRSRAVT